MIVVSHPRVIAQIKQNVTCTVFGYVLERIVLFVLNLK